jgi:hypothetical protein
MNGCLRLFRARGFSRAGLGGGIVHLRAERRKTKSAENDGKLGDEVPATPRISPRPTPFTLT